MNRLAEEKSPYLLQHRENPVAWQPWGEAAFEQARRENKPVFLSIGYSTCHWCHVMAHESFENPEIAGVMNDYYVNIKVDREERPDVDRLYMAFVQASTGSGGWPMSVWLTPDGEPFYGGTYFPPEDRYGRPGFPTVLERIAEAWQRDRPRLVQHGREVLESLAAGAAAPPDPTLPAAAEIAQKGFDSFDRSFDAEYGGFGDAPKFPRPVTLNFLFRIASDPTHPERAARALAMASATLRAMADGGMHDQLGGGFHRYSVDRYWHVPHYEKMLYDQAQLTRSYLDAYQLTGQPEFAAIALSTLRYVARDLCHADGGFYSAEDADSVDPEHPAKHAEGAFYVWRQQEILDLLGPEAGQIFAARYGVEPGGNSPPESDPHGELSGKNTLVVRRSEKEIAEERGLEPALIGGVLSEARATLLRQRNQRPRPHLDDKILTAWNGLMIGAFARAAAVLPAEEDRRWALGMAERAAGFVLAQLRAEDGGLLRAWREGPGSVPAFAEDYAFLISGLLDLYEARLDRQWLETAVALQDQQDRLFGDPVNGGYFSSRGGDPLIRARLKEDYDGAEPSGNSIAAGNLIRLARILHESDYEERARQTIRAFGLLLDRAPYAVPQLACALALLDAPPAQLVLAGDPNAPDLAALLEEAHRHFLPDIVLAGNDLPSTRAMTPINGTATAYLCRNFTCQAPVTSAAELATILQPPGGTSLRD